MTTKNKKVIMGVTAASATALSLGAILKIVKTYKAKKAYEDYRLNHANSMPEEITNEETNAPEERHYIKLKTK